MIRSKKSFEIQFNWIFVLVAGAAIIFFFSTVIIKQKNASDFSAKTDVLRSFESIIAGAESSLDTTSIIDLPESEISIQCGTISIGTVSRQYSNLVIFAPGALKGTRFITQTSQFNIPYRASNLLSVTSANLNYVLVGTDSLTKKINATMPKELRKETRSSQSGIRSTNSYKTRIVVVNPSASPPNVPYIPRVGEEVSVLEIKSGDENKGELIFYSKPSSTSTWEKQLETKYTSFGMLMSAVYSDHEIYKCSSANALRRAATVTQVYIKRTQALSASNPDCVQIYSRATTELNAIKTKTESGNMDIMANAVALRIVNSDARKMSCPLIY
jgi:hypothetical protein